MSEVRFSPEELRRAASGMDESAQDLAGRARDLMGQVSDLSVLGTNDTLGGVASMLYSAVLARVQETVESVTAEYAAHAQRLDAAGQLYAAAEAEAVAAAGRVLEV